MRKLLVCVCPLSLVKNTKKREEKGKKEQNLNFLEFRLNQHHHTLKGVYILQYRLMVRISIVFHSFLFCFVFVSHLIVLLYSMCVVVDRYACSNLAIQPVDLQLNRSENILLPKKKKEKKFYELIPILYLVLMLCSVFFFSGFVFHFLFCLFHLSSCFHSFIRTHHHWVDVILHPILLYTSGIYGIRAQYSKFQYRINLIASTHTHIIMCLPFILPSSYSFHFFSFFVVFVDLFTRTKIRRRR